METNGNLDRKGEVNINSPGREDTVYLQGVTEQILTFQYQTNSQILKLSIKTRTLFTTEDTLTFTFPTV